MLACLQYKTLIILKKQNKKKQHQNVKKFMNLDCISENSSN